MGDIRLLVTKSHGPDEPLHLNGFSREALPNKRRLCDHTLPRLLLALARPHDLEHLVLRDAPDLRERNCVLGRLVFPLLLDCC